MSERKQTVSASDEHAAEPPLTASLAYARGGGGERDRSSSPHSGKFRFATGALIGVAVAALLIAASLLIRGGDAGPSQQWSQWKPQDDGTAGAQEIADHLAPLYRIDGVNQLAVVTVANVNNSAASQASSGTTSNSTSSGLDVAVRPDPASSSISLLNGNTIAYNLCGIGGTDCSIGTGTPSQGRLLLLRREALELALYTFKYISGTDNVVALLPPGHTTQTSSLTSKPPKTTSNGTVPVKMAVLFLHDELKPFLDQPLSATLPLPYPPTMSQVPAWQQTEEAALVEQVTARGLFQQHLSTAQDGSNLLVLDPLPPA
jgi:hypothetical protein